MNEEGKYFYSQPDYRAEAKKNFWAVKHAVRLITRYHLRDKKYVVAEDGNKEFVKYRNSVMEQVKLSVKSNILALNIREFDDVYSDEVGDLIQLLNVEMSKITPVSFIVWAMGNGFDIPEGFHQALPHYSTLTRASESTVASDDGELDLSPEDHAKIEGYALPVLKKKVKELTNEKVKWDQSITAATKVGMLFYEQELERPATEAAFKAEYKKWFGHLPASTIEKIYRSLPHQYRNRGERPTEKVEVFSRIDEDMVDTIMEASVVAGFITHKEGTDVVKDAKTLAERLEGDSFEVPAPNYLKRIVGTCKRVAEKMK